MSWTEKKSSAEVLFRRNDFEKAMEGYAAAAEAATEQNAAPRDVAKCYTNACQMAWRAFMNVKAWISESRYLNVEAWLKLEKKNAEFASCAYKIDATWVKGSIYMLRFLAFRYVKSHDDISLQRAKELADDILTQHYSDLPLTRIKDNWFWLGLCLINHQRYSDFITQCPGFDAVQFPERVIFVSPTEYACFNSLVDVQSFLFVMSGCTEEVKNFSILLSPGAYSTDGLKFENLLSSRTDIVGNRTRQSLAQLKDAGMKSFEGGSTSSDPVVLEFGDESLTVMSYNAPPSEWFLSRLFFIDRSKLSLTMFFCRASTVNFNNCFFASEFKLNPCESIMLFSSNSGVSLEDCVITQADVGFNFDDKTKAVFKNNIIESYNFGLLSNSSQVEIEKVQFNCHLCIASIDSEVKLKKSILHEEPRNFVEHAPGGSTPLVKAHKSTLSIHDSVIGSEYSRSYDNIDVADSKFVLKSSKLIAKDSSGLIRLERSNTIMEDNTFNLKQQTKSSALVVIDKTTLLEIHGNVIPNLDEILTRGIEVFDVVMPVDGIKPKSHGSIKICFGNLFKPEPVKFSADLKHVSVHFDRMGLEGRKKSKAGKRLSHFCSKVEPDGEKSFHYCGQCKIVSYCSKECQTKDWKKEHKNQCLPVSESF